MIAYAKVCYGWVFEEGYKFPWHNEDENKWYADQHGFTKENEHLIWFTEEGQYRAGIVKNDPIIDQYFTKLKEYKEKYPFPVEIVMVGHYDYPSYILAVSDTLQVTEWAPKKLNCNLVVPQVYEQLAAGFIDKYDLKPSEGPVWLLVSYYG